MGSAPSGSQTVTPGIGGLIQHPARVTEVCQGLRDFRTHDFQCSTVNSWANQHEWFPYRGFYESLCFSEDVEGRLCVHAR